MPESEPKITQVYPLGRMIKMLLPLMTALLNIDPDTYGHIVQVAGLVLSLIASFGGIVRLIQWLKEKLGTHGIQTIFLKAVVVTVFTILNLIVQGVLTPDAITWANATAVFILVWTAVNEHYQTLLRKDGAV